MQVRRQYHPLANLGADARAVLVDQRQGLRTGHFLGLLLGTPFLRRGGDFLQFTRQFAFALYAAFIQRGAARLPFPIQGIVRGRIFIFTQALRQRQRLFTPLCFGIHLGLGNGLRGRR